MARQEHRVEAFYQYNIVKLNKIKLKKKRSFLPLSQRKRKASRSCIFELNSLSPKLMNSLVLKNVNPVSSVF